MYNIILITMLFIQTMAGGFVSENDPNYNFKGFRKYLNSYTLRGRFNVCMLYINHYHISLLYSIYSGFC